MKADMILKRILIYSILFSTLLMLGPIACMTIGKNFRFMDSFIVKIDTPTYGNDTTMLYLNYFNKLGNGKVLSYDSENGKYDRTIVITEVDKFASSASEYTVGQAHPRWNHCLIEIKKGLDNYTYSLVLYHEYLHCLGYNHVKDDESDLMYPSLGWPSLDNLKKYAKDVAERRK